MMRRAIADLRARGMTRLKRSLSDVSGDEIVSQPARMGSATGNEGLIPPPYPSPP
jgi:hypothetical protein